MDKFTYKQIREFVQTHVQSEFPKSQWFTFEFLSVYLRVCRKVVDRQPKLTITVSNVTNVMPEKGNYDKQGHFKSLMVFLENLVVEFDVDGIFVETASSPRILDILQRNGYFECCPIDSNWFKCKESCCGQKD